MFKTLSFTIALPALGKPSSGVIQEASQLATTQPPTTQQTNPLYTSKTPSSHITKRIFHHLKTQRTGSALPLTTITTLVGEEEWGYSSMKPLQILLRKLKIVSLWKTTLNRSEEEFTCMLMGMKHSTTSLSGDATSPRIWQGPISVEDYK